MIRNPLFIEAELRRLLPGYQIQAPSPWDSSQVFHLYKSIPNRSYTIRFSVEHDAYAYEIYNGYIDNYDEGLDPTVLFSARVADTLGAAIELLKLALAQLGLDTKKLPML